MSKKPTVRATKPGKPAPLRLGRKKRPPKRNPRATAPAASHTRKEAIATALKVARYGQLPDTLDRLNSIATILGRVIPQIDALVAEGRSNSAKAIAGLTAVGGQLDKFLERLDGLNRRLNDQHAFHGHITKQLRQFDKTIALIAVMQRDQTLSIHEQELLRALTDRHGLRPTALEAGLRGNSGRWP